MCAKLMNELLGGGGGLKLVSTNKEIKLNQY